MLIALLAMACLMIGCDDGDDTTTTTTTTFTVKEVEALIDSTDYKKSDSSKTAITLASDTALSDGTKVVDLLNEMAALKADSTKYDTASEGVDEKYSTVWTDAVYNNLEVEIDGASQGYASITLNGSCDTGAGDVTMKIAASSTVGVIGTSEVTYVFTWADGGKKLSIKKSGEDNALGEGDLKEALIALWNKAGDSDRTNSGTVVSTNSSEKYAYKVNGDGFTQWVLNIPSKITWSSSGEVDEGTIHFFMEYGDHHLWIKGEGAITSGTEFGTTTVVLDNVEYENVIASNVLSSSASETSFCKLLMANYLKNMPQDQE